MKVVEIFETLQGEGSQAGRPAIFIRLAGCNLWSGLEATRGGGRGQCALWCDTWFRGGEHHPVEHLIGLVTTKTRHWSRPFVVITGGEPMLQLRKDDGLALVESLFVAGVDVAIETNGTIDSEVLGLLRENSKGHVTVSPKPLQDNGSSTEHVVVRSGTDLKVIVPTPFDLGDFAGWDFKHRFVQPMDAHHLSEDQANIVEGLDGPSPFTQARESAERYGWRISIQTHKLLGLP